MKKLRFILVLSLLTVFCFSIGQIFATAETIESGADWDVSNTVTLDVKSEYVDELLQNISGAFNELDLKAVYITKKDEYQDKCYLSLLIVLNDGGDAKQDAAVEKLSADPRFTNVRKSCDAPFETENTLHLVASSDTVKAGDTFTIKPEGTLKVYQQLMEYDKISVMLKNYDPEKEYTLADFPYFDFVSMKKTEFGNPAIAEFILTLAQPGYFNVYKAVNALALDPAISSVYPCYFAFTCDEIPNVWEVSDSSVADFANKVNHTGENYEAVGYEEGNPVGCNIKLNKNGEVVLKALKPGKVTVTYVPAINHSRGTEYAVTYDITVLEKDVLTSDSDITAYLVVSILSVGTVIILLALRKNKFFN